VKAAFLPGGASAGVEQRAQDQAVVVARAADVEVPRGVAPVLREPLDVALEAAGGGDDRRGP
jgi:hypothetical protein